MSETEPRPRADVGPVTVLCVHPDAESVADGLTADAARLTAVPVATRAAAADRLDAEGHDCVVSGYQLPDGDGVSFLRDVRETYANLPFVVLADNGSEGVAADAVNAGADGYFQFDDDAAQYEAVRDRIRSVVADYRERQAERETRSRLLQLAESSDSAVWMFTADWSECIYVNSTYEDIWGRSVETLMDDPMDFMEGIHPDARDAVQAEMGALAEGEPAELEYRVNPEENYQRWVHVQGQPVFDHAGNVKYIAGFARDVTERKEREDQLRRQNQEMEVFNSLLRHDVLNGITVIRTRADLLADDLEGDRQQYAETIVEWSDNMTGLVQRIRDVLATLTGDEPELERVNLSRLLREQAGTVDRSYPEVSVDADVPDGVFVEANELLSDVFKNLLTNAVEHNDTEGLRIDATAEVDADTAVVRVADNGAGVPDDRKDDIFRRGTTGHVKQTGSGFGLFFVDAMVTAYGGTVHVEDNDAGGATFVVELPVLSE